MNQSTNPLLKTSLVPGWLARSLFQQKRSLADLANYRTLREYATKDEIAEWVYLNEHLSVNGNLLGSWYLNFFTGLSNEESLEFKNSVVPLSGSEDIASSVKTRLSLQKSDPRVLFNGDKYYDFVIVNNTIFVLINEGFAQIFEDKAKKAEFLKEYLEKCYSMTSRTHVSEMAIFTTYLTSLAQ